MKNRFLVRWFAGVLLAAAGVAGSRAATVEDIVASVNGRSILLSEYLKEVNSVTEHWRRSAPAALNEKDAMDQIQRKVLDQMVDNALLQQEAEKRKIKIHERELETGVREVKERSFRRDESGKVLSDVELERALDEELKQEGLNRAQFQERIRKQLMIRKVIEETIRPKVREPEEADVRAAFEKIQFIVKGDTKPVAGLAQDEGQAYLALGEQVRNLSSERVRVSHILVKLPAGASILEKSQALKKAQELRKRLKAGEEFAELARKNSEDAESAQRGGDLGFILRGWMPPEFEKAAFAVPVGEGSEPVETSFGYHLIRVQEKKAAEGVSFEKLKDDLRQFLTNLRFQAELGKAVQSLRTQAHIEVHLPQSPEKARKAD